MGSLAAPAPVAYGTQTEDRASIVAALATVAGLNATPTAPDVPTEGAAWPTWVQTTYSGAMALMGVPAYDVYALLPAGYSPNTSQVADELLPQVVQALWPLGQVQLAEPVNVRFENQTAMPGLRLRLVMRGINR